MTNFDQHFHTSLRPLDRNGNPLKPFDLVIIDQIPGHYYAEPDTVSLREYTGKFGLITYFMNEPYYCGRKAHPGWVSGDGSQVQVVTRRVGINEIFSYDFWLPPSCLQWIPKNMLIMNLFSELVWQMRDDEGPSCHHFVVRGMEQFAMIEQVLSTPYAELVKAHDAAMAVISSGQ